MNGLLRFILAILVSPFRSKARLEAEIATLRQQLIVLQRKSRGRVRLTHGDRLLFIQLYRWFPAILPVLQIVRPETLVRWHGAGFRSYWRWKSRNRGGRPQIDTDLRALIGQMSLDTHSGARRASMASFSSSARRTAGSELVDVSAHAEHQMGAAGPSTNASDDAPRRLIKRALERPV